jgi:hypothetical protein
MEEEEGDPEHPASASVQKTSSSPPAIFPLKPLKTLTKIRIVKSNRSNPRQ